VISLFFIHREITGSKNMSREIFITQQILLANTNEVIFLVASTAFVAGLFDKNKRTLTPSSRSKRFIQAAILISCLSFLESIITG